MQREDSHISDQDLALAADGVLPSQRAARVQRHLAECWQCRTRMADIHSAIADFVHANQFANSDLPPIAGSRALLQARLAELSRRADDSRWPRLRITMLGQALAYAFVLALCVVMAARLLHSRAASHAPNNGRSRYALLLPNPELTPGSVRPVTFAEVCSADHDDVVKQVSQHLEQQVFQEYGMNDVRYTDYEVDYLISPGLGGSDEIRNLWPEPHYTTPWNSYVKDQLEDYFHHLVCSRKISLATAQREIATDWISAYKRYFHTDKPLRNPSA